MLRRVPSSLGRRRGLRGAALVHRAPQTHTPNGNLAQVVGGRVEEFASTIWRDCCSALWAACSSSPSRTRGKLQGEQNGAGQAVGLGRRCRVCGPGPVSSYSCSRCAASTPCRSRL